MNDNRRSDLAAMWAKADALWARIIQKRTPELTAELTAEYAALVSAAKLEQYQVTTHDVLGYYPEGAVK